MKSKIEFKIEKLTDENLSYFEITASRDCLKNLENFKQGDLVKVDYNSLNLSLCLYGKTKKESIKIQKENCKKLLSFYKFVKKAVKTLSKKGLFDGKIYVNNLDEKKNNNDLMLIALLDVDFNWSHFKKMQGAYEHACDFLDAENSLNKMCNFYDNHCTKHREKGIDKSTGCCPSFCKIRVPGQACEHKNLACKIFMCDYLINEKGYYFTPNTLAVLTRNMSIFERGICFGILCRTEKKSLKFLWFIRILTGLYIAVLFVILGFIIF